MVACGCRLVCPKLCVRCHLAVDCEDCFTVQKAFPLAKKKMDLSSHQNQQQTEMITDDCAIPKYNKAGEKRT